MLAQSSADVAAAVNFARERGVRLVVKGGGHSYLGCSSAPDSLLIWTRPMRDVELDDAFVPQGADAEPEPAVNVGAGAIWIDAYNAVTTVAGRYVQGGGCTTVGVAGLLLGGGFGSFSKGFMAPLKALAERPASYVNETDYFQDDWQTAFWGDHYARLTRVKHRYDPGGLFTVHHGVGTV